MAAALIGNRPVSLNDVQHFASAEPDLPGPWCTEQPVVGRLPEMWITMATAPLGGLRTRSSAVARLAYLSTILGSAWAARSIFNPFQELVRTDLGLGDVEMSLVQGAAMSVPSILLSIIIGRLIDTRKRVMLLALLNAVTMLGVIGTAFSQGFVSLAGYRALAGLGMLEEVVVFSLVADLFPPEQRGRANIMIVVGDYAGSSLGFALAGWLLPLAEAMPFHADHGGWRSVQCLFGLIGLLATLPLLTMREPDRQECSDVAGLAFRDSLRSLWRARAVLGPLLAGQIAMAAVGNIAWIWALPSLYRTYGLAPTELGDLAAGVMAAAALIGALGAGLVVDRLAAVKGSSLAIAAFSCALAIPASLFPFSHSLPVGAALLFLLVLANTATALSCNTFGVIAIPNDLRGLWFGISGVAALVVGYAIAPTLVACLSDLLGGERAMATALAIALIGANAIALAAYVEAYRVAISRPG